MMTWREMEQLAIDTRTCFMCKAKAHEPCRTKSGRLARYTHATRVWPIHEAWSRGYQDGERNAKDLAIDVPEHWARQLEKHRAERDR